MHKKFISFIIPTYNEEEIIEQSIAKIYNLEKIAKFELIIGDDGSNDLTYEKIVKKLKEYRKLRIVRNKTNKGRGSILKKAFKYAGGDYLIYIDADLSIDLEIFNRFLDEMDNGADIVIGSKHLPESNVEYPIIRRILSKAYSNIVRIFFNVNIRDFQCGFKGFKKEVIKSTLKEVKNDGWFWDTEMLILSYKKGFKIVEIPAKVVNIYKRESKVNLLKDTFTMGINLVDFWIKCKK